MLLSVRTLRIASDATSARNWDWRMSSLGQAQPRLTHRWASSTLTEEGPISTTTWRAPSRIRISRLDKAAIYAIPRDTTPKHITTETALFLTMCSHLAYGEIKYYEQMIVLEAQKSAFYLGVRPRHMSVCPLNIQEGLDSQATALKIRYLA